MAEETKKPTVVMYAAVGAGHLGPMIHLAKFLLPHGLSVAIAYPEGALFGVEAIAAAAGAPPSISFHGFPPAPLPPGGDPLVNGITQIRLATPHLLSFLRSLSASSSIRALVIDMFCTDALDVALELRIPSYFFVSTSASVLAAFLHLAILPYRSPDAVKSLKEPLTFPGIAAPMLGSYLPDVMLDHGDEGYTGHIFHFERFPKADGIITNTFSSLEEKALTAISGGLCTAGKPVCPVYCIGPLVAEAAPPPTAGTKERHPCLSWLDAQPRRSVVFLCFGSMGSVPLEQLREIAVGLDQSGQRFLWVVRRSAAEMEGILPEGFVSRTADRGLVVTTWAPQAAVLKHEAVGGFVTHCGWNSVLEALVGGVPMIAWPMYSEQKMNKVSLVDEWGLAAEMRGWDEGLVPAGEMAERIRWLMESEGGRKLRERAAEVAAQAAAALSEGGTSHAAVMELIGEWKGR